MSNINVTLSNRRPQILITQNEAIVKKLDDILDVNATNPQNGAVLVYNSTTQLFETTTLLFGQTIDGGSY